MEALRSVTTAQAHSLETLKTHNTTSIAQQTHELAAFKFESATALHAMKTMIECQTEHHIRFMAECARPTAVGTPVTTTTTAAAGVPGTSGASSGATNFPTGNSGEPDPWIDASGTATKEDPWAAMRFPGMGSAPTCFAVPGGTCLVHSAGSGTCSRADDEHRLRQGCSGLLQDDP